jgi:hypothetical protein
MIAHRFATCALLARRGRGFVLLALSLLLAGCFTSTQPKFPLSSAVPALGDGGRYVGYERMSDGSFKREEAFDVRKRADGGYDFVDAKGKVTTLSLHRIGPDRFVAQAREEGGVHYIVLQVRGNEVLAFAPDCKKQDVARLTAQGVDIRQYECVIDAVTDPTALFAGLNVGEPGSKMVRE